MEELESILKMEIKLKSLKNKYRNALLLTPWGNKILNSNISSPKYQIEFLKIHFNKVYQSTQNY